MALTDVWTSQPLDRPDGRSAAWARVKSLANHVFATRNCVLCLFIPCILGFLTKERVGPNRYRYRRPWPKLEFVVREEWGNGYYWMTDRKGIRWEGQLQDSKKHGKTKITWPNGNSYVGRYQNGKANGPGLQLFNDGSRYRGEFRDSKQHGFGIMTWAEGDSYEGEFKEGKLHGTGIYRHAGGQVYEGPHRNGQRHGIGQITDPGEDPARCEYCDGDFVRWLDEEPREA